MKILSNYDIAMNLLKIIKDSTPKTTNGEQKIINSSKNILKESCDTFTKTNGK